MRPEPVWQGTAPATGWRAVFVDEAGTLRTEPVAFWALLRRTWDDGESEDSAEAVLGRTGPLHEISMEDDYEWFVGYVHESEDAETVWRSLADHVVERVKRQRERRP